MKALELMLDNSINSKGLTNNYVEDIESNNNDKSHIEMLNIILYLGN